MMMICPKSRFLILKYIRLEENEAEGLKDTELDPHFPYNFRTSISRCVTTCQEHTAVWRVALHGPELTYKHPS